MDLAVGRREAQERPLMRPVIGLVSRYAIPIDKLPVNLGIEVGKCFPHVTVQLPDSRFVGSHVGLRCVIDEIIGKQLFEYVEVSAVLDLLGIPAHDCFRLVRRCHGDHTNDLLEMATTSTWRAGFLMSTPETPGARKLQRSRPAYRLPSSICFRFDIRFREETPKGLRVMPRAIDPGGAASRKLAGHELRISERSSRATGQ